LLSLPAVEAQDYRRAWDASVRAAQSARRRLAYADAIALYRRAVAAGPRVDNVTPGSIARAWSDLGRLYVRTGRLGDAKPAYARARRLAGDDIVLRTELYLNEGEVRLEQGEPGSALRWYQRGLRASDDAGGATLRSKLLTAIAKVRLAQSNVAAAMASAEQAVAEAEHVEDPEALAAAWSLLGAAAVMIGAPEAEIYGQRALALYRGLGDAMGEGNVLNNLGTIAYLAGDWDAARTLYGESSTALTAAGATVFAATTANNVGEILRDQGRLDEARAVFDDALVTLRAAGSWYELYVLRNLAVIDGLEGNVDAAREQLRDLLERFSAMGVTSEIPETQGRLDELKQVATQI
jgi:tetratricopeptide (TPR) repeat protein